MDAIKIGKDLKSVLKCSDVYLYVSFEKIRREIEYIVEKFRYTPTKDEILKKLGISEDIARKIEETPAKELRRPEKDLRIVLNSIYSDRYRKFLFLCLERLPRSECMVADPVYALKYRGRKINKCIKEILGENEECMYFSLNKIMKFLGNIELSLSYQEAVIAPIYYFSTGFLKRLVGFVIIKNRELMIPHLRKYNRYILSLLPKLEEVAGKWMSSRRYSVSLIQLELL